MGGHIGGVGFVVATAALALWVAVRWPWHPPTLRAVVGHAAVALFTLQLSLAAVHGNSPAWWRFAGLLIVIGPALVYTWLSAAWTALFFRGARNNAIR